MADEVYKPGGLSPEDRLLLNNFRGIPIDDEPVYEEDEPIYEEADPISDNIGLGATTPEASKMFYEFSEGFERPLESADPPDQFERWLENRDSLYNNAINEGLNEKEALARSRIEANASMLMGVFGEFDLEKSESPGDGPIAAGGRVFSRRIASVQPREEGVSTTEQRFEDTRKEAQRMQLIIEKEGLFPAVRKAMKAQEMSPEDAENMGIGINSQTFFGRDMEDEDQEGIFMPYGLKNLDNLAGRAAIKIGIPNMFANLFLEDDEIKAFTKEYRTEVPTESFERMVDMVQISGDKGLTDLEITKTLSGELTGLLMMQSYDDLPANFRLQEPSVKTLKAEIDSNPSLFQGSRSEDLINTIKLIDEDASDKEIQESLNFVPFGALPSSVWIGSTGSMENVLAESLKAAHRVIKAKGEEGRVSRALQTTLVSSLFETQKIGSEIVVVENRIGQLFRLLGFFTEGVAEARLPFDIPITPASRDFYYSLGIRDQDSTFFARMLANVNTGNVGWLMHTTNEAKARNKKRGDPEFHFAMFIGGLLDFLVPWEKLHIGPVAHVTKATARGSSMVRKVGAKGFKQRAFMSGFSPKWYDFKYRVHERAMLSFDRINSRFPGNPTKPKLRAMLDQDEAAQVAKAANTSPVLNDFGGEVVPMSLQDRVFAEQLFKNMDDGLSYTDSVDKIAKTYVPDAFDTMSDATMAVVKHLIATDEAGTIFKMGANSDGVIPFTIDQQMRRVMTAAGVDSDAVIKIVENAAKKNKDAYLSGLRVLSETSDAGTRELRASTEYITFRKQLERLVRDGNLLDEEKVVLLNIMETRAHNAAGVDVIKSIATPEDFFRKANAKKVKTKLADGSPGPDTVRIRVGKIFDTERSDISKFIGMLKSQDVASIMQLLDNDSSMLVMLMGKGWVKNFFKNYDTQTHVGGHMRLPKNRLTTKGKIHVESVLRSVIHAEGSIGSQAPHARQLFGNLVAVYARMDERLKNSMIPLQKKAMLDQLLRPDRFFRNELIEINYKNPVSPGARVRVSSDPDTRLAEGRVGKTGRKRVFADIDTHPDYVRQALGLTDDIKHVDAVDFYARSIGYVIAETMKKEESTGLLRGMDLVSLTGASFARRDKVKSIRKAVNSRMAAVLGIEKTSKLSNATFLDAGKLVGMADSSTSTITLSLPQQAQFKVFLRRLVSEPIVGKRIPDELMGAGSRVDEISFVNYNRVVELLTDVEAGVHARRTVYTEVIPRSLAYSMLNTFKSKTVDWGRGIDVIKPLVRSLDEMFVMDDPLKNIRPEFKILYRKHLSEVQGIRKDVMKLAAAARKADPEATIEQIFDGMRNQLEADATNLSSSQIRLLMGESDLVGEGMPKKGILSILEEFTGAEISRIELEYKNEKAAKANRRTTTLESGKSDIISGQDEIVEPGLSPKEKFTAEGLIEGESRFQYLTKNSTVALLQDLASEPGFNGLSEKVGQALAILQRYSTGDGLGAAGVAKLTDVDRVALADALYTIQHRLKDQERYVIRRGEIILTALGGDTAKLKSNLAPSDFASAYMYFHEGGTGWKKLLDFVDIRGKDLSLGPSDVNKYSPAQAYLEMIVRLMAEDKLMGMYDDMIKHGMPGSFENYRIPTVKVTNVGGKYAIDTVSNFHNRVRGYMHLFFNESQDITSYYKTGDTTTTIPPNKPSIDPDRPYKFSAYDEPTGRPWKNEDSFQDLDARIAAEEVLVRFGMRTGVTGDELVDIVFPDGSIIYGPKGLKDELDAAIQRAASVGSAYGSDASRVLDQVSVGSPYTNIPKTIEIKSYAMVADGINQLLRMFPITFQNIKRGITTGLFIPNPAYYTANFLGGAFQLFTAVNPVTGVSMLAKNPKMVGAVMSRMFGEGTYKPFGNHIIVGKNGMIYNADQVTDMALLHRLNSSFIQAETQQSLAEDIKRHLRKRQTFTSNKVTDFAHAWNDYLAEVATSVDSFYRVSIFVDGLMDGLSPGQAASLAKKAAFDYGALTDWEKKYMRNTVMFYSYLRKNMDLFYDTLLTNPSRVTNQLRLANGLHRANLEEDPQIVLPEYLQTKMTPLWFGFKKSIENEHAYDQRMYTFPQIPLMDSAGMAIDVLDGLAGDQESQRMLLSRLTPWVQAPFVLGLNVDPFYGGDLDEFNKVPQWLIEWDLAVTGGMLKRALKVTSYSSRNQKSRLVEGDQDRQVWLANNGKLWWFFKNALQIPGFGRSMTIFEQADRANLGVIETITEALRSIRISLEEAELVDVVSDQFVEGDTMSPRFGFTERDEGLRILGVTTTLIKNLEQRRRELLKENQRTFKERHPQSQNRNEQARKRKTEVNKQ